MTPSPVQPPLRSASHGPTRDRILDAFTGLLIDQGERSATLENVAAAAGLSKGGLLYHFASKEALLEALLGRMSDFIQGEFEHCVKAQAEGPGRVARAMIEWGFGVGEHACNERHERAAAVFLAAFHHDPALLDPVRAVVARSAAMIAAAPR